MLFRSHDLYRLHRSGEPYGHRRTPGPRMSVFLCAVYPSVGKDRGQIRQQGQRRHLEPGCGNGAHSTGGGDSYSESFFVTQLLCGRHRTSIRSRGETDKTGAVGYTDFSP